MALSIGSLRPRPLAPLLLLAGLLLPWSSVPAALAKPDLRASFPGRRIGGGTRGECNSRLIVHLVPASSVYAPGTPAQLALLEGPAANPRPIALRFRPQAGGVAIAERVLPAGGPALVLLAGPALAAPTLWETSYRCEEEIGSGAGDDPLQFVESTSPPALSLLLLDATPADTALQARIRQLQARCGGSISRAELASSFGLADLLDSSWPDQLPVRCPS